MMRKVTVTQMKVRFKLEIRKSFVTHLLTGFGKKRDT